MNVGSDAGSVLIKKALDSSGETLAEIDSSLENIEEFRTKIFKQITIFHNVHRGIKDHLEKIEQLEGMIKYFLILQDIQDIK